MDRMTVLDSIAKVLPMQLTLSLPVPAKTEVMRKQVAAIASCPAGPSVGATLSRSDIGTCQARRSARVTARAPALMCVSDKSEVRRRVSLQV
ncbi:hypothetical protein RRG08_040729 [Elysia crispata]|uniref:Uncharacterized protein n=1 Tax=Elysia crispata TaxID=231223 RepID=A0AAE1BE53_9GAST|nr:hypothetical protein RRG08_040729 [Elysia crispata]